MARLGLVLRPPQPRSWMLTIPAVQWRRPWRQGALRNTHTHTHRLQSVQRARDCCEWVRGGGARHRQARARRRPHEGHHHRARAALARADAARPGDARAPDAGPGAAREFRHTAAPRVGLGVADSAGRSPPGAGARVPEPKRALGGCRWGCVWGAPGHGGSISGGCRGDAGPKAEEGVPGLVRTRGGFGRS